MNNIQIYATQKKKKDLQDYASKNKVSMSSVLWEAFYKLIGKSMPK